MAIIYKGFGGEQSINLSGNVKTFDHTIRVKPINSFTNPFVLGIIGDLVIVTLHLLILLEKVYLHL